MSCCLQCTCSGSHFDIHVACVKPSWVLFLAIILDMLLASRFSNILFHKSLIFSLRVSLLNRELEGTCRKLKLEDDALRALTDLLEKELEALCSRILLLELQNRREPEMKATSETKVRVLGRKTRRRVRVEAPTEAW